jgi:hypothetical protein
VAPTLAIVQGIQIVRCCMICQGVWCNGLAIRFKVVVGQRASVQLISCTRVSTHRQNNLLQHARERSMHQDNGNNGGRQDCSIMCAKHMYTHGHMYKCVLAIADIAQVPSYYVKYAAHVLLACVRVLSGSYGCQQHHTGT